MAGGKIIRSKRFYRILTVAVVAGVVWFACDYHSRRGAETAAGIYFADGGRSYIEIETAPLRRLRVVGCSMFNPDGEAVGDVPKYVAASMHRGRLSIRYFKRGNGSNMAAFELTPSSVAPGDWDLTGCSIENSHPLHLVKGLKSMFTYDFWSSDIVDHFRDIVTYEKEIFEMKPAQAPFVPFLRRLDDARLPAFFEARLSGDGQADAACELARALGADYPGILPCVLHRIDMEAERGAPEAAEALWDAHAVEFAQCGDPLLMANAYYVWGGMKHKRLAPDLITPEAEHWTCLSSEPPSKVWPIEEKFDWFEKIGRIDGPYYARPFSYAGAVDEAWDWSRDIDHIEWYATNTGMRSYCNLLLLRGENERARKIVLGVSRLTVSFTEFCVLSGKMFYVSQTLDHLDKQIMHTRSREELKAIFDDLEALANMENQTVLRNPADIPSRPIFDLSLNMKPWDGEMSPLMARIDNYLGLGDNLNSYNDQFIAHYQCLRIAAAACLYRSEHGELPSNYNEIEDMFPANAPFDPFNDNKTPGMKLCGAGLAVYSPGDDGAFKIDWEHFEGGEWPEPKGRSDDIVIKIPANPDWAIPEGGARADNAREFLEKYPGALEAVASKTYAVWLLDATTTQPLMAMTCGGHGLPNAEKIDGKTGEEYYMYSEFLKEKVFIRPGQAPDPELDVHYYWDLAPFYDPRLGVRSRGDIFVEIPSSGDIVLEIPAESKNPFPAGGVCANTASEFAAISPNGLPPDPFANTPGRGFSLLDATTTRPLAVFSFGPDTDEYGYCPPG